MILLSKNRHFHSFENVYIDTLGSRNKFQLIKYLSKSRKLKASSIKETVGIIDVLGLVQYVFE